MNREETFNISEVKGYLKILVQLTEQEYMTKMQLTENNVEQSIDKMILKVFHSQCHKDEEEIKKFLSMEGLNSDKVKTFLHKFNLWKKIESSKNKVEISDREQLLDLQWKLVVKSGGTSGPEKATLVQLAFLVEKNGQMRKHHLNMGIATFYDFLHKLTNGNEHIQRLSRDLKELEHDS